MWSRGRLRGALAALAAILAVLGIVVAPFADVAMAQASGVAYLPPSVQFKTQIEKTVLSNYQVDVPAATQDATTGAVTPGTASIDLSQYLPQGISVDAVRVKIENASGNATIKALDAQGNVLASADIVPLASGYETVLPPETTQIQIENLASQVWQGVITVVVEAGIEVELRFHQTQINITNGQAIVGADIVVKRLPYAGSLSLVDDKAEFDVGFWDSMDVDGDGKAAPDRFIAVQPHTDATNPVTITTDARITTSAPEGTYTVKVTMYFHEDTQLAGDYNNAVKVGELAMTVTLAGDGTGTAEVSEDSGEGIDWKMLGLGAVAAVAIIFLASRAR